MAGLVRSARAWAVMVGLCASAACHPATAQGGACAPPPAWRGTFARPVRPDAELAACLRDKAYQARGVHVPVQSKVAGLIAQCEVEVDQFEGALVLGGGDGSDEQRAAVEQQAEQEAAAAIATYQGCPSQ